MALDMPLPRWASGVSSSRTWWLKKKAKLPCQLQVVGAPPPKEPSSVAAHAAEPAVAAQAGGPLLLAQPFLIPVPVPYPLFVATPLMKPRPHCQRRHHSDAEGLGLEEWCRRRMQSSRPQAPEALLRPPVPGSWRATRAQARRLRPPAPGSWRATRAQTRRPR